MDNKSREELRNQLFKQLEEYDLELSCLESKYGSVIDKYLFLREETVRIRRQILSV